MNVWWLGVKTKYCTFEELKERHVVAQGWPHLGDLREVFFLGQNPANEALFKAEIETIFGEPGGDNAPDPFWNLSQIKAGDLVVAAEGVTVKGICRVKVDAWSSYQFQPTWARVRRDVWSSKVDTVQVNYAQTVCGPVQWRMWSKTILGDSPKAGRQGVYGCQQVRKEYDSFVEAWKKLNGGKL